MDGMRLAQELAGLFDASLSHGAAAAIDEAAGQIFRLRSAEAKPLPGARRLIDTLIDQGMRWAIATSSRPEDASRSIAQLAIEGSVVVVDASSVAAAKPAPDLFLTAARRLGVESTECWVVGDSTWDIQAAQAAGMASIAVTAGSAVGYRALVAARPTSVVETLDEVVCLLKESGN
jgi:HAD superfamily hydrolase (TIGR01509 family)